MAVMRAKFQVGFVHEMFGYAPEGQPCPKSAEQLTMHAVARKDAYPDDGSDEDNTYAKFTPGAALSMNIANPALWGQFKIGDEFYVDFTKAPE